MASTPTPRTASTETTTTNGAAAKTVKAVKSTRIVVPLSAVERLLKRDEADLILFAGNAALVVLEVVEWPVAALFLFAHLLHRTRFKGLTALAEVAEEVE